MSKYVKREKLSILNEQRREMLSRPMTIEEEVEALDRWKRREEVDVDLRRQQVVSRDLVRLQPNAGLQWSLCPKQRQE